MPRISSKHLIAAKNVIDKAPAIDFHTHLGLWETRGLGLTDPIGKYVGDDVLKHHVERMLAAGCKTASLNLTSDVPILQLGAPGNRSRDFNPGEAWGEYQRLLNVLNDILSFLPAGIVRTKDDISALNAQGKLALMLSVEGGHMVEEDISRLAVLKADGVSKFQPIHYARTTIGDNQTDAPEYGGLSEFGKKTVAEAARLGMIVDAAHATFEATRDMAYATSGPIVLSHTLMTYESKIAPTDTPQNPRWISQDHARLIADTGGLIGTWCISAPYGAGSAAEFVEAVMAMIDVVGIDHICWATDLIQSGMGDWFSDYDKFVDICALFLTAGLNEDDLAKFLSGNVLRLYNQTFWR